jgi:hypothetical protein
MKAQTGTMARMTLVMCMTVLVLLAATTSSAFAAAPALKLSAAALRSPAAAGAPPSGTNSDMDLPSERQRRELESMQRIKVAMSDDLTLHEEAANATNAKPQPATQDGTPIIACKHLFPPSSRFFSFAYIRFCFVLSVFCSCVSDASVAAETGRFAVTFPVLPSQRVAVGFHLLHVL